MDACSLFSDIRLVPVVSLERISSAVPLAEALQSAGLRAIEVTLRTPQALDCIESIAKSVSGIIVGAGSIRTAEQFQRATDAGARFLVSPGSTEKLLQAASDTGCPFVPGAVTASEMIALLEHGYTLQKFFPAEQSGGLATIKAISAPLPEVKLFPTGGITQDLAREYLNLDAVKCIGGSWFVPQDLIEAEAYGALESNARRALRAIE
jgi:2-dehydro-3-deoxyphosphogluconate aldolase/(4S)-4-hydroxy-2-oxoglutarate aldolase